MNKLIWDFRLRRLTCLTYPESAPDVYVYIYICTYVHVYVYYIYGNANVYKGILKIIFGIYTLCQQ